MKLSLPGRSPRTITLWGNPILRTPATPVTTFDRSIANLVEELFDTMYSIETGVGLAANQIGRPESVFVFDCQDDVVGHVINPVVEPIGTRFQDGAEGCLSLPGYQLETVRLMECRVKGQDLKGDDIVYEGSGLRSRCFQHETDHLNGRLYIDCHDSEVTNTIEDHMRTSPWYGNKSLDPSSELYRRSQEGDTDVLADD